MKLIAVVGFIGYYIYHTANHSSHAQAVAKIYGQRSKGSSGAIAQDTSSSRPTYNITTTIPATWKTYANKAYNFSIYYPSSWVPATTNNKLSTVYASMPLVNYFSVDFQNPATPGNSNLTYDFGVTVTNQSLSQTLATDENSLVYNNTGPYSAVSAKVIGTKYYTFKGYKAVQLDVSITDKNTQLTGYNVDFIVYANGASYDFYSQNNDINGVLSSSTVATALGSLSIY